MVRNLILVLAIAALIVLAKWHGQSDRSGDLVQGLPEISGAAPGDGDTPRLPGYQSDIQAPGASYTRPEGDHAPAIGSSSSRPGDASVQTKFVGEFRQLEDSVVFISAAEHSPKSIGEFIDANAVPQGPQTNDSERFSDVGEFVDASDIEVWHETSDSRREIGGYLSVSEYTGVTKEQIDGRYVNFGEFIPID